MKTHLLTLTPAEFCAQTHACGKGREFALQHPTMADVWDNCPRVDWLVWVLNAIDAPEDPKTARLFMVWCARNTPLLDGRTTGALLTDPRSLAALDVAERWAQSNATDSQLSAAWSAAWSAAESAAWSAAESAAESAARSAAWSAAESAAWSAAWSAQANQFRKMVANPFKQ